MGTDPRRWQEPLLGVVLTALGIFMTLDPENGGGTWLDTVVIPAATLPVLWRRSAPFGAAVAISVGIVVSGLPTFDQTRCGVAIPAALFILFSVASRCDRARASAGLALVLAAFAWLLVTDPQLDAGAAFIFVIAAGVWGAGRVVRLRNALAASLADRSREIEATRDHNAQMAVELERERLSSDLELLARGRLGEVVQLAQDPERSTATFEAIEREGRASLDEMRGLLGVLRSDAPGAAPLPSLAQIEDVISGAGNGAVLLIEGERRPLPIAVELAAYRVVQHALDVLGSGARVVLRYMNGALEVEISGTVGDTGATDVALASARERVMVQGGTFAAEAPQPSALLVTARLPVATGV